LEGKDVEMSVTVKKVRERELPPADDEFAMLASEFDTIDELTDDVRDRLISAKRIEQGMQARGRLHDALVEAVDFPLPESLVAHEVEEHFQDGHGDDDHRAEFQDQARARIKSAILLDRIAEKHGLDVSQDELSAWLIQQAPRYGMTPDQFANELVKADQVSSAVTEVRRAKALAFAMEQATIVDPSGEQLDLDLLNADVAAAMAAQAAAFPQQ
jgi:trigger factor